MLNNEQELRIIEQKIEDAHQRLLSIDQQFARVQKMHNSEKVSIEQLQQIKADLTLSTADLDTKKDTLNSEISTLVIMKGELSVDIDESEQKLKKVRLQIETEMADSDSRKVVIESKQKELGLREGVLVNRETEMSKRESDIKDKHSKIKVFAESL